MTRALRHAGDLVTGNSLPAGVLEQKNILVYNFARLCRIYFIISEPPLLFYVYPQMTYIDLGPSPLLSPGISINVHIFQ